MLTKRLIAASIRHHRTRLGWSMAQAAANSGIRAATFSDLENARLNPTIETLDAVAYTLGITTADLFQDPGAIYDETQNQES
jgi:transcriptional regulator with XRE-family HTH domain